MRTPDCAPAFLEVEERSMSHRRRFKQTTPLKERLSAFITAMQERAEIAPPGPERDEMLKKVQAAQTAVEIDGWTNSHDLQPPR
jgi:hypothetical protein